MNQPLYFGDDYILTDILYDNSYISKYKEPICKIYHSKIYLENSIKTYIKFNCKQKRTAGNIKE